MEPKSELSWERFVQWLFYGLLTAFATMGSGFLFNIQTSIREMSKSIIELNQNFAGQVIIQQFHQRALDSIEVRVQRLEDEKPKKN